jgi:hypothetical protein
MLGQNEPGLNIELEEEQDGRTKEKQDKMMLQPPTRYYCHYFQSNSKD